MPEQRARLVFTRGLCIPGSPSVIWERSGSPPLRAERQGKPIYRRGGEKAPKSKIATLGEGRKALFVAGLPAFILTTWVGC